MADKANKSSSSIRLPAELRDALKKESYERFSRGEPEPSYGDLLLEAWRIAKKVPVPAQDQPPKTHDQVLTQEQRDILAMLEINDFPFKSLKGMINDALEVYRKKHKPDEGKHPRSGHGGRPTGTR